MPDNFIISFDGGNGKIGDEHCNSCLLISTKNTDNSLTVLHSYHNEEAIHLWNIMNSLRVSGTYDAIFSKNVDVVMVTEK